MNWFLRALIRNPLTRPVIRFLLGMVAIPTFRLFLRRVVRLQDMDEELEKDLEQWFRASLILLAATANMEDLLFGWLLGGEEGLPDIGEVVSEDGAVESGVEATEGAEEAGADEVKEDGRVKLDWIVLGGRILLAIGVIETMPDQELFAIIHPGPPHLRFRRGEIITTIVENWRPYIKGLICQHVNRSSPVFAILSTVFTGTVGWVFYLIAIAQYLVIGLVTSREHALDVLGEFDKQVMIRRRELMDEFDLKDPSEDKAAEQSANSPPAETSQPAADSPPAPTSD